MLVNYLLYSYYKSCIGIIWALPQENLILSQANNKGADQPAHVRSLISAFVVHFLKSIIAKLASYKILSFYTGLDKQSF